MWHVSRGGSWTEGVPPFYKRRQGRASRSRGLCVPFLGERPPGYLNDPKWERPTLTSVRAKTWVVSVMTNRSVSKPLGWGFLYLCRTQGGFELPHRTSTPESSFIFFIPHNQKRWVKNVLLQGVWPTLFRCLQITEWQDFWSSDFSSTVAPGRGHLPRTLQGRDVGVRRHPVGNRTRPTATKWTNSEPYWDDSVTGDGTQR